MVRKKAMFSHFACIFGEKHLQDIIVVDGKIILGYVWSGKVVSLTCILMQNIRVYSR